MSRASNIEAAYPLSPMQQGILFHSLQDPQSSFYFQQTSSRLEGDLDPVAFARAWKTAMRRHAVLRTAFEWEHLGGKILQVVLRDVELPLEQLDWRGLGPEPQAEAHHALLRQQRQAGLDLSKAPLMRLTLARLGERAHQLIWSWHHILLDGWSSRLLMKEVAALYSAFVRGASLDLPAPPPFRDYITWLQRQSASAAEAFWRGQLAGFEHPTPLPGGGSPPRSHGDTGERKEPGVRLSRAATAALVEFGRRRRITLNTMAQGAWAILLSRYSSEPNVVFGATVSGRPPELPGVEAMLGLFISTLPVRARLRPHDRLADWLSSLQASQVEATQYAYAALVDIHGWSELPRGARAFDSILVFENYPADAFQRHYFADVPDPEASAVRADVVEHSEPTNYPLVLLVNAEEELSLRLAYDPARFTSRAIERMLRQLGHLLESMPANADAPVRDLRLSSADELDLAAAAAAARRPYPADALVHTLFLRQAAETPDAPAVIDGERGLTYRELDGLSNRLARWLEAEGIGPEQRVGVCLASGVEMVAALVAILKAGGAYVPFDPAHPRPRIAQTLDDARPKLVLVHRALAERLPATAGRVVTIEEALGRARELPATPLPAKALPTNAVYVMYTSGSTGKPKGVVLTHDCLANLLHWHRESLPEGARILQYASLGFNVSFHEVFAALSTGAAIVPLDEEERLDVHAVAEAIRKGGVEKLTLPVIVIDELAIQYAGRPEALRTLRHVIATGERLRITDPVRALFSGLPQCRLHNHYGPSETHLATVHTLSESPGEWEVLPLIGEAIANARLYVLGPDLDPVPAGGTGELYIGGATLARGYWAAPELTAERFLPDPFGGGPGARMYRTGDLVSLRDDGTLHFLGRIDRQVKIRGVRVEPGDVEAAAVEHPSVRQCAVVVKGGDGAEPHLVAYLVAEGPLDVDDVRAHLARVLPRALVPGHFVVLDRLPTSPNGKLDVGRLPSPDLARPHVEPRTPVERLVAETWSAVLSRADIGARDHFFELGGHSLRAVQVTSRLREVFGDEIPLAWIFEYPTPEQLAGAITALHGGAADRIAELWMEIRDTPTMS